MNIIIQGYKGTLSEEYSEVWRWANSQEVKLWKKCTSHIPLDLSCGDRVYVTRPGAPQP